LVRMKVIPDVRRQSLPTDSATPGGTADDLLVRLKLVPPRKKQASISAATSDSRPIAKGKSSVDRVRAHSLPLFDLSGVQHPLTKELSESAMDSSSSGNGKRKSDRDLGHSLPLFGHDVLSSRPILVGANGNGHSNGNGHREQSAEDDFSNPLPLFGTNNVVSSQATNGNTNGNH
jgi:RND superfamily putative drug exporter